MTNWQKFKIINKVNWNDGTIKLDLDDAVPYDNYKHIEKYVRCPNHSYGYKVGDYIEIDIDESLRHKNHDFYEVYVFEKAARKVSSSINIIKEYERLKSEYDKLFDNYKNLASSSVDKDGAKKILNSSEERYNRLWDKYSKSIEDYNNLVENSVRKEVYEEMERKWKKDVDDYNKLVGEKRELVERVRNLQDRYNDLSDRFNDINTKYEEMKDRYEDTRDERESERVNNARTNTRLGEKVESLSSQVIDFKKRLKDTENERDKLLIKLDEKNVIHNQKLEAINNQLTNLRIESGEKDSKLREKEREIERKEEEIKKLRSQKGLSQEELLTEKLRSEKKSLELFANHELKIDMEQIHSLSKYHERLLVARKNHNQANVDVHEGNISRVKKELQERAKISVINIQEICQKCERIAEFSWELNKTQQQYEARQEVPTNNNF